MARGLFTATVEGAVIGSSLAERSLAIAAFSVLLMMSTDPTDLVRSLVQQARMPARFAYPALAAYRFLPLLQGELETIRLAHRLRGVGRRRGAAQLATRTGASVTSLAGERHSSRRARRVGDGRARLQRTATTDALPPHSLRRGGCGLVVAAVAGGAGILLASAWLGVLRVWSGVLSA